MRLSEIRREVGVTQVELAARMGLTQSRVSAIERADAVSIATLERYAAALGGQLTISVAIDGRELSFDDGEVEAGGESA